VRGGAYTEFWRGNLRERDHLGEPGVDGRIILRWIFRKWDVWVWTGSSWLSEGQMAGTYKCGNELSGSIKCGEFLD
jgi:hypothetical protein